MTIRLDLIFLILEVLKLQDYISISWLTLILIMITPYILSKLLVRHIKKLIASGVTKIGPITLNHTKM